MNNNQLRHSSHSWGVKRRDGGMLLKKEIEGNRIILRRGAVGNDLDGTPLLINGRGEAYRVNDTAISLWNMCNGITFDDLLLEVLRISSGDEDDVKKSLEQMIRQFHKISMIEVKEMK
jgi:Coenzyme PQQ synthesis protein D (PqqD)